MLSKGRSMSAVIGMLAVTTLAGCATILQGSRQQLSVASRPTGARVLVDGKEVGTTPVVAHLKRKDKHVVRVELQGYQPFEMPLARSTSGWVWGNLVFGGIPGLAIDAITGGMYKLKPEQIDATLEQSTAAVESQRDAVVVAVVLRTDPTWERIGTLTPGQARP
jgi:hypothetical protein